MKSLAVRICAQYVNCMNFESITFFPDGSIWQEGEWDINSLLVDAAPIFKPLIDLDSKRKKHKISSPIGELEFVWTGSNKVGVSTLLKDGVTVNAAVHLPGNDLKEEINMLKYFIDNWREFPAVKELNSNEPFSEALSIQNRPFLCSVNWATLKPEQYLQINNWDIFISSVYFELVNS